MRSKLLQLTMAWTDASTHGPSLVAHEAFINSSLSTYSDPGLFFNCWRLTNCEACLSTQYPCSWCATSQVCVPNEYFRFPFALLAPIKYENICPLAWRERWEMRAKPFSCRCSTMTLMSVVVAVLSTLAGFLLIFVLTLLGKWMRKKWKAREDGWWRFWQWRPSLPLTPKWRRQRVEQGELNREAERRPLLNGA